MKNQIFVILALVMLAFVFLPMPVMAKSSRSSDDYKPSKSLISSIWSGDGDDDKPRSKGKKSSKSSSRSKSSSKKSGSSKSRSRK